MSATAPRSNIFCLRDYGVAAYLEKPFSQTDLRRCIMPLVAGPVSTAGETIDDDSMERALLALHRRYSLTSAQREVLRCAARGLCRGEIARARAVSRNTVKTQIRHILAKTGDDTLGAVLRRMRDFATAAGTREAEFSKSYMLSRLP
jgi:DNA-binding NarL/FixJ family response regulator